MDGCREDSRRLRDIREQTGIQSRKELMDYAMQMAAPETPDPGLGAAVSEAAGEGDPYAAEILQDAARCLFRLTQEAILKLGMDRADDLPVGIWGSVLMRSATVREELARLLKEAYPHARMCIPEKDAAQGAVEIALERYGTK